MSFLIDSFLIASPSNTPYFSLNHSGNSLACLDSVESPHGKTLKEATYDALLHLVPQLHRHETPLQTNPRKNVVYYSLILTGYGNEKHYASVLRFEMLRKGDEGESTSFGRDDEKKLNRKERRAREVFEKARMKRRQSLASEDSDMSEASAHNGEHLATSNGDEKRASSFSNSTTTTKLATTTTTGSNSEQQNHIYLIIISKYKFYRYFREMLKTFYETLRQYDFEAFLEQLCRQHPESLQGILIPRMRFLYDDLFHLMHRCPAPISPGRIRITTRIRDKKYAFQQADVYDFAMDQIPLRWLFRCLDEKSILQVLTHVLLERKTIFTSSSLAMLNYALEAFQLLMYPFEYPYTLSVITLDMLQLLESPVPYLLACPRCTELVDAFRRVSSETDEPIILVDLDTNRVSSLVEKKVALPEKECEDLYFELRKTTSAFLNHFDFVYPEKEIFNQRKIQEIFAVFFAKIVGSVNFRHFDKTQYLSSRPARYLPFLSHFVQTAIFQLFQQTAKRHHFYFELANTVELSEVEELLEDSRRKSKHYDITYKARAPADNKLPDLLLPEKYTDDQVPRYTDQDVSAELYKMVARMRKLIPALNSSTSCTELYSRALLLQVGVLSRSKDTIVAALMQLNEIMSSAPQIVRTEFAAELLSQLPEEAISCVSDMEKWVQEIVEEEGEYNPALYSLQVYFQNQQAHNPMHIRGRPVGRLLEIPHFDDQGVNFEVDVMKVYKNNLSENDFVNLLSKKMDLMHRKELNCLIFESLSEHCSQVSLSKCEQFIAKLRLYYTANKRITKWLVNDNFSNDAVIARSELCSRMGSTGQTYSGRIFLTTHFVWFGMTSFRRICALDAIESVDLWEEKKHKKGGIQLTVHVHATDERTPLPQEATYKKIVFALTKHERLWLFFLRSLCEAYQQQKDNPTSHIIRDTGTLICVIRTLLSMGIHPSVETLFGELLSGKCS
mmetsp:Transcript_8549/g.31600  ORF Transcript_8549/g.31600 Transcript_8549/m.31600 type:complete len:956 (+) Transcript_8549:101-2968(+)